MLCPQDDPEKPLDPALRPSEANPLRQDSAQDAPDALFDRIRERAYQLWEDEGRPEGRAEENWAQAEREIRPHYRAAGPEAYQSFTNPDPGGAPPLRQQPGISAKTGGTPGAPAFGPARPDVGGKRG